MSNTQSIPVVRVTTKRGIQALNPVQTRTVVTASRFSDLIDVSVGNAATTGSVPVYNAAADTFTVKPLTVADLGITALTLANLTANAITGNVASIRTLTANSVTANVGAFANLSFTQLYANNTVGSNGQILTTNGNTQYWADPPATGVSLVGTGTGLTGGPITSTGSISVVTGATLVGNSSGIHVNPSLSITNLTLTGNLTVQGTTTQIDATSLVVKDNMIGTAYTQANTGTFTDAVDGGFYTVYGNTSAKYWAGLARIAAQSQNTNPYFKLFATTTNPDGTTIDTGASLGTLAARLAAPGLTANTTAVAITANSSFNVAIVANSVQFDILDCGTYP